MVAAVAPLNGAVELKQIAPGRFAAHGPFTFTTARRAREAGLKALHATSPGQIEIDCGGITSSDSAGMTVLLDWLASAKHAGRSLRYANLPEQVRDLAHIADVLELLEKGV